MKGLPSSTQPTTTVSQAHMVANLGPCPSKYPTASPAGLNAHVFNLQRSLVPISTLSVRICRYESFAAGSGPWGSPPTFLNSRLLTPGEAVKFATDTNRLVFSSIGPGPCSGGPNGSTPSGTYDLLTFANDSQQVQIAYIYGGPCLSAQIGNGYFLATPTPTWRNELAQLVGGSPQGKGSTAPVQTTTSSASTGGVTTPSTVSSGPIPLVQGRYGFLVPQSWALAPLK